MNMRRIGFILVFCAFFVSGGFAASRVATTSASGAPLTRQGATSQRVRTSVPTTKTVTRVAPTQKTVSRTATQKTTQQVSRGTTARNATTARAANVVARATTDTRTGAEYESCKTAYFTCMDQFCQLKNDDFRRCSCSDRISTLQSAKDSLNDAKEQLVAFNENLDIVGKTALQATAMNTASDGENALTRDTSASKALLNAIMNSIRGDDAHVENNNLSPLNSIDLSFDAANSFGTTDVGQAIASYNGTALYSAVYPSCRNAVKSSCNDASLQRAVNAYLMAIEQDCNTVQTAIQNKQKETHAAIRESSSLLDLARAENHQKHNEDDLATCIANIESAILSEEVCGANYHKCLDNGEYIDVSTGAPIAGVIDFYKLGTMLTFNADRNNAEQKLAQNPSNRTFVTAFEKRVKQFAEPALDKCYDESKTAWNDYLNKAMLDIYYAQQSKVNEIKQVCFDFVSACYMNGSDAMTNAMQGLVAAQTTNLNPDVLKLNQSLCADYIASCNNMFDGQIIADYINNRHDTDSLTACRAVAKQCFDNYGGLNYENFYNPDSGLFKTGSAPDWFSLYERNSNNGVKCNDNHFYPQTSENPYPCTEHGGFAYKSECAKQLAGIDACNTPEMIEKSFGGFDFYNNSTIYTTYAYINNDRNGKQNRLLRSAGIATEVYNQIIDILQTQCSILNGKFMNVQNLALYEDNYDKENFCEATFNNSTSYYGSMYSPYSIGKFYTQISSIWSRANTGDYPSHSADIDPSHLNDDPNGRAAVLPKIQKRVTRARPSLPGDSSEIVYLSAYTTKIRTTNYTNIHLKENMCPRDYGKNVDTASWGACLCWENGGRRSNNGTSTRCVATFPARPMITYNTEQISDSEYTAQQINTSGSGKKCTAKFTTYINQDPSAKDADDVSIPLNMPLNENQATFSIWEPDVYNASNIPSEQDWCEAEVNGDNQVCPFGVGLNNGVCKACPFDWSATNNYCCPSNANNIVLYDPNAVNCTNFQCVQPSGPMTPFLQFCCPQDYTGIIQNGTNGYLCVKCPSGYNFVPNTKKCTKTENDSTITADPETTTVAILAQLKTELIMTDKFPKSGSEINVQ
jgi:hypothetical protein